MKRPGDDRAGYTLLDELRRKGKDIPYIIYASSNAAQHKEQAKQHGALDATNNPPELFRLVMGALKNNYPSNPEDGFCIPPLAKSTLEAGYL